ncbi:MAG: bifunctional riboflavin kinase/FAD synthetase [Rubrobacteraceae bacterium]|nr:bifunctional riboflavin kinase/FAD synthetase [Rubrobacteraceae bacterium]MCL6437285.1 bifunctional riboflavin kinase/FAD synthetase [Rubrobacteraceae bacterium]
MRGVVVALGNFDGVHLGHRAVIRAATEEGARLGIPVFAATFWPHPREVLSPGGGPPLLTTLEQRRELLLGCGVDEVRVVKFDAGMARKSPREFVEEVLLGELGARVVVVGENFRFGHRAAGSTEDLEEFMRRSGGRVRVVGLERGDGERVSSTRIRELIARGEVREAARLLGRPHAVRGEVMEGEKRGRKIGFPTANLIPDGRVAVPARGVYAGFVRVEGEEHAACTNVGVAPTFGGRVVRVEAHILDFQGDLYGRTVDVAFVERIRSEKRFSGVEELRDQIATDVHKAREILQGKTF